MNMNAMIWHIIGPMYLFFWKIRSVILKYCGVQPFSPTVDLILDLGLHVEIAVSIVHFLHEDSDEAIGPILVIFPFWMGVDMVFRIIVDLICLCIKFKEQDLMVLDEHHHV